MTKLLSDTATVPHVWLP